jgi:hypothetical protein
MAKQPPKERLLCPFYDYKRLLRQGYPTRRRWLKAGRSRLVDKLALQSAADEFRTGFHLHLAKHAVTVGGDASRVLAAWIGNFR